MTPTSRRHSRAHVAAPARHAGRTPTCWPLRSPPGCLARPTNLAKVLATSESPRRRSGCPTIVATASAAAAKCGAGVRAPGAAEEDGIAGPRAAARHVARTPVKAAAPRPPVSGAPRRLRGRAESRPGAGGGARQGRGGATRDSATRPTLEPERGAARGARLGVVSSSLGRKKSVDGEAGRSEAAKQAKLTSRPGSEADSSGGGTVLT